MLLSGGMEWMRFFFLVLLLGYWLEQLCLKNCFHSFKMRRITGKTLWKESVGL